MNPTDLATPLPLAQALIRCASITPADAGATGVLAGALAGLGFNCHAVTFEAEGTESVANLYARLGTGAPHFCFAGHTDVVPPGDLAGWSVDPFAATVAAGKLFGRGAADMKSAIAAFVAAVARALAAKGTPKGSISLLITGDEEGPAVNGTKRLLQWAAARGERWDACLVGEPTCPDTLGDMIKIGRRGSLSARLTVLGAQGHVAYPHLADNPLPRLVAALKALADDKLDDGNDWFQPSSLQLTTIDVGNAASNVIPAKATARLNVRFNNLHSGDSLKARIAAICATYAGAHELAFELSGESFLTPPGALSALVAGAVRAETGIEPQLSTTGGTSDARFIKDYCPVVEFGLVGRSMHKVDEQVALDDLERLTRIYGRVLAEFLAW